MNESEISCRWSIRLATDALRANRCFMDVFAVLRIFPLTLDWWKHLFQTCVEFFLQSLFNKNNNLWPIFGGVSQGLDYNRKFVFYFGLKIARFFNYFGNFNLQVLATSVCQSLSPPIISCESIKKTSRALHAGKWGKKRLERGQVWRSQTNHSPPPWGRGELARTAPPIPFPDVPGGIGSIWHALWICMTMLFNMLCNDTKKLETLVLCSVPKHIPSKKIFCVLDYPMPNFASPEMQILVTRCPCTKRMYFCRNIKHCEWARNKKPGRSGLMKLLPYAGVTWWGSGPLLCSLCNTLGEQGWVGQGEKANVTSSTLCHGP